MERVTLTVEPRTTLGKKVKDLRRQGLMPAVVYGKGVPALSVQVRTQEFEKLYKKVGSNTIVKLVLDDEDRNVLIHEPAVSPVTGALMHADLYQVNMAEKITAEVPIHFIGDAPAVRELDGTLITNRDSVEVECLPLALPQFFEVDLSTLDNFDKSIKVSDIKAAADVEILTDAEETLASVEEPRSEEELAALEEAPVESEMPEVEGEEKAEGEAGAEDGEEKAEGGEEPKGEEAKE